MAKCCHRSHARLWIAGVARTFQNIRLFGNMTALENVMVGRYCRTTHRQLTSILRGPKFRRDEKATAERAQELLDFVGLGHTTDHLARNLPTGTSGDWRSPGLSSPIPSCCCWMSRQRA